jgi:hypothetical protein
MKIRFITKAQSFIEKNRLSGVLIALISFILVSLFSFSAFYENFELKLYDVRFRLKPPVKEWSYLKFQI